MRPRQDFPSIPRRVEDQPKRREGPYYGDRLRRLLAPEPTDPSIIDRLAEWWMGRHWPAAILVVLVISAIVAAFIVNI
jgi:hypothetical protein